MYKTILWSVALGAAITTLVGCIVIKVLFFVPTNTNQLFEIVDIKIDSMIEITFQNVNTAEMYKINYLKKYCKNINSIELGSEWSLPVTFQNGKNYLKAANLICEQ